MTTPDREQALGGWQTIDTAPFTFTGIFPGEDADKWLDWSLLGRFDHHGFVMWVGGMDAGQWLYRDDSRSCGETDEPTHWMPLPPAPVSTNEVGDE